MAESVTDEEEALSRELMNLRADSQVVRAYGEEHPDEFAALRLDHGPPVRIAVLFSGDRIRDHEIALRRLVAHPDRLEVLPTRWSLSQLGGVLDEVKELARGEERGSFRQYGPGYGVVTVVLRADKEALAARLEAGHDVAIRLILGTASFDRESGYALSPGQYLVQADAADSQTRHSKRSH